MKNEVSACLINQTVCGRVAGNPVCPACGMDERVVYPGQADREAAQAAALVRYGASQEAVQPPSTEPPIPSESPAQPQKRLELEPPVTQMQEKTGVNRLGVGVLALALLGGGWWWKTAQDHRVRLAEERMKQVEELLRKLPEEKSDAQSVSPYPPALPSVVLEGRYLVMAKGNEVKDQETGLVWARCSVGQLWDGTSCEGEAKTFNFEEISQVAEHGWRVPTVRELNTLVWCSSGKTNGRSDLKDGKEAVANLCVGEYSRPTIRMEVFPGTPEGGFWSSSKRGGDLDIAWLVNFDDGSIGYGGYRSGDHRIRLIRGSP